MKKILFYGDSNTYGYDPRGFFGGRYAKEEIWTSLVAKAMEGAAEIRNEGMNGRTLPDERQYRYLLELLEDLHEEDLFVVMLGTNDLLMSFDATEPLLRMEAFLQWFVRLPRRPQMMIIAPPYCGRPDGNDRMLRLFYCESIRMNEGYRELADRYSARFADAGCWNVPMAYDAVHFSEEGHKVFAEEILKLL